MTVTAVKKYIRVFRNDVDWRVNVIRELMMLRDNELFGILEPPELAFMLDALCTS